MNRIDAVFAELREKGESALIPYIPVGYPTVEGSASLIQAIAEAGADIIELGVPYADALADGPTIQEASLQAVTNGVNLKACISMVQELRSRGLQTPIVFMGYCNSFLAYGLEALAEDAKQAGVDGFIIPDLPSTMAKPYVEIFESKGLKNIFFLAPTTSKEREAAVVDQGQGFLYCISVTGVTGERKSLPEELPAFVKQARSVTNLPLAVGFGISNEHHVREVSEYADGAIVGSALINVIRQAAPENVENEVRHFIQKLKQATRKEVAPI
ncbi:tryptophan synthase alpha chain [Paenibacillus shirakamiensis]|uniref:Tryptophan synthase alpha chain n=1 Tax=Paenibacillus shirakamiensis TaxID=1265935 RepID=A0ABS4JEX8_9BACL|nr:tryptophan synthase subunit alpha [Paenibacillus shirakamiensis]MBP2000269.1 tryptophan synthase alpha chain [Paenibacillus shirakamiensis]